MNKKKDSKNILEHFSNPFARKCEGTYYNNFFLPKINGSEDFFKSFCNQFFENESTIRNYIGTGVRSKSKSIYGIERVRGPMKERDGLKVAENGSRVSENMQRQRTQYQKFREPRINSLLKREEIIYHSASRHSTPFERSIKNPSYPEAYNLKCKKEASSSAVSRRVPTYRNKITQKLDSSKHGVRIVSMVDPRPNSTTRSGVTELNTYVENSPKIKKSKIRAFNHINNLIPEYFFPKTPKRYFDSIRFEFRARKKMKNAPLIALRFEGVLGDFLKKSVWCSTPVELYLRKNINDSLHRLLTTFRIVLFGYLTPVQMEEILQHFNCKWIFPFILIIFYLFIIFIILL